MEEHTTLVLHKHRLLAKLLLGQLCVLVIPQVADALTFMVLRCRAPGQDQTVASMHAKSIPAPQGDGIVMQNLCSLQASMFSLTKSETRWTCRLFRTGAAAAGPILPAKVEPKSANHQTVVCDLCYSVPHGVYR